MKKALVISSILFFASLPSMAIGQAMQPFLPAVPPQAATGPAAPGMGPWAPGPACPIGPVNRQLLPQETCQPARDVSCSVSVPNFAPGFGIYAGFLLLQPSADNLGWAVVTNVLNPASPVPVASPFWTIQTLTPNYYPGFEVGARYAFCSSGKDLQANWQHLRTKTSNSVVAEESLQWVSPFSQTGPSSAQSFNTLGLSQGVNRLRSAEGQVEFAYDVVNIDFGQHVNVGSSMLVRMFAGVRYAKLEEQVVSSFFGAPPSPDSMFPASEPLFITLNATSTYTGAGPRFGLDTAYELFRGFRFTGQLAAALLVGRKQPSQYLFRATSPELAAVGIPLNPEHIASDEFNQVVYSCDAKLGIGCSGARLSLEAGYMAATYIDPFSAYETNHNVLPLQIGSLSTASMRHTLSNFTVNGPYFAGGFKW